jgi:hypothetical protein
VPVDVDDFQGTVGRAIGHYAPPPTANILSAATNTAAG